MAQETALQVIELQQLPIIVERLHSVQGGNRQAHGHDAAGLHRADL